MLLLITMSMLETVRSSAPTTAAFTSCSGLGVTEWNSQPAIIKSALQSWLLSTVTVLTSTPDQLYEGVSSRLYNPVNQSWSPHWPGVNHLVRDNYLEDEARQRTLLSGALRSYQELSGALKSSQELSRAIKSYQELSAT